MYKYLCFVSLFFSNLVFSAYYNDNPFHQKREKQRYVYDKNTKTLSINYSNLAITDDYIANSLREKPIKVSQTIQAVKHIVNKCRNDHWLRILNLDLSRNNIHDDGAKDIAKYLEEIDEFVYLNISYNQIMENGLKDVIDKLIIWNINLKELNITGNPGVTRYFINFLNLPSKQLLKIKWDDNVVTLPIIAISNVEDNKFNARYKLSRYSYISNELTINYSELNITDDDIVDDMELMFKPIRVTQALEAIKEVICFYQNKNAQKFRINLSKNTICNDGAQLISDNFKNFSSLFEIDVSDNRINQKGLDCLVKEIASMPNCLSLDVRGNYGCSKNFMKSLIPVDLMNKVLWEGPIGEYQDSFKIFG